VEEGILPHRESLDAEGIEEERRLMYVGVTRAQRTLHVSHCERRKLGREVRPCEPSRFIAELGGDIVHSGGKSEAPADKAAGAQRLAALRAMLGSKAPPSAA
jgi:ATP-dependent DNA helicase Rep